MDLIEISEDVQIKSEEIKDRATQSSKNAYTKHYIVKDQEDEIAFLSLDLMHKRNLLFLYEILVINSKRRQGYCYKILDLLCDFAQERSFNEIHLDPNPFDRTIELDVLKKIYGNKGFEDQENTSQMKKCLLIS